jgi:hypothetical protein
MQMLVVLSYVGIMTEVVKSLILELDAQFPEQSMLDAMGIVYMQYWLQADAEVTFLRHLEVLKGFYFSPQPSGQYQGGKFAFIVLVVLLGWDLDA